MCSRSSCLCQDLATSSDTLKLSTCLTRRNAHRSGPTALSQLSPQCRCKPNHCSPPSQHPACLTVCHAAQEVKNLLATIEELDAPGLGAALTEYGVKAPDTGNDISAPFPFNLMFKTSIGPRSDQVGYLRPETAQGIFVNFKCVPAGAGPAQVISQTSNPKS